MNFKELYAEQKNVIWTVLILAVLVVGFLTIAPQVFHASSSVNAEISLFIVWKRMKKRWHYLLMLRGGMRIRAEYWKF